MVKGETRSHAMYAAFAQKTWGKVLKRGIFHDQDCNQD